MTTIKTESEFDDLVEEYELFIKTLPTSEQKNYYGISIDSCIKNPLLGKWLLQSEKNCVARAVIWRQEHPKNAEMYEHFKNEFARTRFS